MGYSTYTFVSVVITHKAMGQLTLQSTGVGSIQFNMSNDTSAHDLAADGSVMTSKVKAGNGTVAISVQQTSDAHKWLTKLNNYFVAASSREWGEISLMSTSPVMQVTYEASNMSIQKRADKSYQQQGQQVTWTFLADDLKEY